MAIPRTDKMCKLSEETLCFIAKILSGNKRKLVIMNISNKNTLISKEKVVFWGKYGIYIAFHGKYNIKTLNGDTPYR
jgi:hypothetical protein